MRKYSVGRTIFEMSIVLVLVFFYYVTLGIFGVAVVRMIKGLFVRK